MLPRGVGVVIACDQVYRDARLPQRAHPFEEPQVVSVRCARLVEHVARDDHEVDLAGNSRVYDAIERFSDGLHQSGSPHRRHLGKAAEGRAKVKIGGVEECQALSHSFSLPRSRRCARYI